MKQKKVKAYFHTRSTAQLDAEIEKILAEQHKDKDINELLKEGEEFAGWSPPHEIHGIPYEELHTKHEDT